MTGHWRYVYPPAPVRRPLIQQILRTRIPFPKRFTFIELLISIALVALFVWNCIRWLTWIPE